jgi:hypothetical protein
MAEPVEALEVLREVWSAQGQGSADLDEALGHHGHGTSCKNMKNVGFDGTDEDLRAAGWTPPATPAVYAIAYKPDPETKPERYAVIYVGHSDDLTDERFPFKHPRSPN